MRKLIAPTEPFIKLEQGVLNADALAGSSVTLVLQNNDHIANNDYVVIGWEGNEICELVQVNQVVSGGTDIRVATLKLNHRKGEPVTKYQYNKRKFYGATSATGTFAELTADGSPVDIQVDDPQGTILEYTGSVYTHFKSTYYNSTTLVETDTADSEPTAGDQSLRYASLYGIRKHAGLAGNPRYSDLRIEQKRKQAENEIDSAIFARYTLPLTEIPGLITYICELLAAGYIDYEELGKEGEGVKWLGTARSLLKAIQTGERKIIGADGAELSAKEGVGGVSSYPDSVDNDEGPIRMFTTNQTF